MMTTLKLFSDLYILFSSNADRYKSIWRDQDLRMRLSTTDTIQSRFQIFRRRNSDILQRMNLGCHLFIPKSWHIQSSQSEIVDPNMYMFSYHPYWPPSKLCIFVIFLLKNFFLWIWNQETRIHFNLDFLSNGNPFPLANTPKGPDTHETRWRLMYNTVFVPPGEMDLKAASRINCRLRNPDCMLCCSYWETTVKYNDRDSETNPLFRFQELVSKRTKGLCVSFNSYLWYESAP